MEVQFYNNKSAANVVHKNMTLIETKQCQIHEQCSVKNPTLKVEYSDALLNANYMYIPKWDRYYYIAPPTIYDANNIIVAGSCDPITSYWSDFKGSPCIAKRSTSNWSPWIDDTRVVHAPKKHYVIRKMGQGFSPSASGGSYILTIGGK